MWELYCKQVWSLGTKFLISSLQLLWTLVERNKQFVEPLLEWYMQKYPYFDFDEWWRDAFTFVKTEEVWKDSTT